MAVSVLSLKGVSFKVGGNSILSNISLRFLPGQITAVIGPSGSGKSTLLKCLTTTFEPSSGTVTLGDRKITEITDEYRQNLGYVPQDDIIHKQLRVDAAFYYAAKLRLDSDIGDEAIQEKIAHITQLLGLSERRSHRISKLSGGQRKRINIGIELLADPQVLVLDEPASGLDPATEEDLMKLLRGLAGQDKTIVKTTHSMEYLSAVDRIVLLQEGHMIFVGSLQELLQHFDIVHVADVYKAIREGDARSWVQKFASSPLAAKSAF